MILWFFVKNLLYSFYTYSILNIWNLNMTLPKA